MSNAFVPIVRTRPCPIFGRPVHPRVAPIDYSPILLLKPFGFRIAPNTLSSGKPQEDGFRSVLAVSGFRLCARLDFSIPSFSSRPARHYPRLWIQHPSSERWRDFNPHDSCAAQRTLWRGPTSRVRASSATVPHLPDADRIRQRRSSRTRDLPGSDAILLHVMWPLTPAGRQHLACRCRTCCLRANENPRPLRCLIFRGSIPHPMQLLCTLRDHCRQGPRNTRYQADATPYLGRTSIGWIAPALPGALIQSPRRRGRAASVEIRDRAS